MLYKNIQAMTDFFDVVAGVEQGETLTLYLFIILLFIYNLIYLFIILFIYNLTRLHTGNVNRSNERK